MPGSTGGSWKRSDWSGSPKWDNPTGNRGHQGFWTYRQNHATAPAPDPTQTWWVRLLASSTLLPADLRGEPWPSEPTLSRPRVHRRRPPVRWPMTVAILFGIAGEVVSLRAAAAASCCPQQILPLIPSSSMRSLPLIDFGDPTNS